MSDNMLVHVDCRAPESEEPMTVEGALMVGKIPLQALAEMPFNKQRKHVVLARLAREYLLDFDLPRACARAGFEWGRVKGAGRDPLFITMVRDLVEQMKPEEVVTRQEILQMMKQEACTASKASDRIAAIAHLARLTGMELPAEDKTKGPPTINITLNGATPAPAIEVNVTPASKSLPPPAPIRLNGEDLL